MNNKALSGVIETVLLIVLTISIAAILFSFSYKFAKERLDSTAICSEIQGQVKIESGKYSCSNSTGTYVMVKKGEKEVVIDGFKIALMYSGTSSVYNIRAGEVTGVKMFNGATELKIPSPGGAETYFFSGIKAETVNVAGIASDGKTCESVSENLVDCSIA